MRSETQRVQFRAPSWVLVTALREYLQTANHDDALRQEIEAAYYDDVISMAELESLIGPAEAANLRVLKQQLSEDFIESVAQQ
ncbi:MAG: hypothetical protein ABEH59_00650 [Halobacteriales archaeon]